jgi:Transglycosylase-like domain
MRRMLERISPVLLVSVAVGGFVVMSSLPATAESRSERLDRLHPGRPGAAFGNHPSVDRRLIEENARLFAEAIAAGETPPVFEPPPVIEEDPPVQPASWRPAAPRYGGCNGDVDCFLECTRAHESDTSGGYGAVSSGGAYRGAYQFQQNTWDAAVAGAGHDEYAGVPADQVPPEVQDAAAAHLYSVSGNNPWGGRC